MNKEEYEIMYRLEDTLWWYVGMRNIVSELLRGKMMAFSPRSDSRQSDLIPRHSEPSGESQLSLLATNLNESGQTGYGANSADPYAQSFSILDAGCGTGGTLDSLRRQMPSRGRGQSRLPVEGAGPVFAIGVDASQEALDLCQQRGLSSLVLASVTDVPFAASSFDLVVSFDVLYHRNVRDDVAALKEFHRLLKPGGRLLLRLPAYNWLRGSHDEAVHTRERYDAPGVRRKLVSAGFEVERVTYANTILFPIAALKRFGEMAFGLHGGSDVKPVSPVLNRLLTSVLNVEARLLSTIDLPWGLSVFALARAPER